VFDVFLEGGGVETEDYKGRREGEEGRKGQGVRGEGRREGGREGGKEEQREKRGRGEERKRDKKEKGYGVAPISRLLKIIGLFCKRAL